MYKGLGNAANRLPAIYVIKAIRECHGPLWASPPSRALEALADLAESGRLRVHLQATLDLAEAAKGHELLASGSVTGKIALTA
jgi:NADPH:quinone reductase-like Zn-dependent oxidoreductase